MKQTNPRGFNLLGEQKRAALLTVVKKQFTVNNFYILLNVTIFQEDLKLSHSNMAIIKQGTESDY